MNYKSLPFFFRYFSSAFFLFLIFLLPLDAQSGLVVVTSYGSVQGIEDGQVLSFKGLPYARPPVNGLRWRPPQEPAAWDSVLLATDFSPACPQKRFVQGQPPDSALVFGQEDCLYLNIWTPEADNAARAVLFFIHGGGNQQGSASPAPNGFLLYDGRRLAEREGVVVVTINYRLGPLGNLVQQGLDAESETGTSGNYGLLDQLLALQWVQDNIAQFGGDPGRVMAFGESAGAVNTGLLLISPLSEGLFSRALMQSGSPHSATLEEAEDFSAGFISEMGCSAGSPQEQLDCLRGLSEEEIVATLQPPFSGGIVQQSWGPVIDGWMVPENPFEALQNGNFNHMPVLIGSNAEETNLSSPAVVTPGIVQLFFELAVPGEFEAEGLELYPPGENNMQVRESFVQATTDAQFTSSARRVARAIASNQTEPVWRYFFNHNAGGIFASWGAYHGLELLYVFQTLEDLLPNPGMDNLAVEASMRLHWAHFAAFGDPNYGIIAQWPPYEPGPDPYFEIKAIPEAGEGLRTVKSDYWDMVRGFVTATGEAPVESRIWMKVDNPLRRQGAIRFYIPQRSAVRLTLFNLLGQMQEILIDEQMGEGEQSLNFSTAGLIPGTYLLRLSVEGEVLVRKVVVD